LKECFLYIFIQKVLLNREGMKLTGIPAGILALIIMMFLHIGCNTDNYDNILAFCREPLIEPDYAGVTIPTNIAPMNFIILEDGKYFKIRVTSSNGTQICIKSSDGIVRFPLSSWEKLLKGCQGG
jgi:hypothetical protein